MKSGFETKRVKSQSEGTLLLEKKTENLESEPDPCAAVDIVVALLGSKCAYAKCCPSRREPGTTWPDKAYCVLV